MPVALYYSLLFSLPLLLLLCSSPCVVGVQVSKAKPRKEDVKFIKCDVCEYAAAAAYHQAQDLFSNSPHSQKKPNEEAFIEAIEKLTTAWRKEGEWITALHIEKSLMGNKLNVKHYGKPGDCGEACKTIEKAAQEVIGDHDTDIAEALFVQKFHPAKDQLREFTRWMCDTLTKACPASKAPLPSGWSKYPPFTRLNSESQNLERMMGEMGDAGLRGQMYSREELMEKYMNEDMHGMGGVEGREEL